MRADAFVRVFLRVLVWKNAPDGLRLEGRSAFASVLFISLPANQQTQKVAFKEENEARIPLWDFNNAFLTIHSLHLFPSLEKPSKASSRSLVFGALAFSPLK